MNAELQQMLQGALTQLAVIAGPILAALLLVGLLIGILQAATQINDPAVGFVPRLTAMLLLIWVMGSWMMQRLAQNFASSLAAMIVK
jgi:flagellar biosynthesis protein FliQ